MYISTSHQERFKVVHGLSMPILAMHLIGNSTRLRGAIQDHYGPLVDEKYYRLRYLDFLDNAACNRLLKFQL